MTLPVSTNLQTAITNLASAVKGGENSRLTAAEIIWQIDDRKLYLEAGYTNFKSFLDVLITQTAQIGWNSKTTINRYLAFYRLYIKHLNIDREKALKASSHLHELYRIATVDGKTKELVDGKPKKNGVTKPEAHIVSALAEIITALVNLPRETVLTGMTEDELAAWAEQNGMAAELNVLNSVLGKRVAISQKGWQLSDTQEVIETILGEGKAGTDQKAKPYLIGAKDREGMYYVEEIEWRTPDGEVKAVVTVGERYPIEVAKQMGKLS